MTFYEYLLVSLSLGLIVSLNPLLLAIFAKKIVADFGIYKSRNKILTSSLLYILGFIVSGILLSKVFYFALNNLESLNFYFVTTLIAIISILFGSIKLISFFYKKTIYSTPDIIESFIHKFTCKYNSYVTSAFLGFCSVWIMFSSYGLIVLLLNTLLIMNNLTFTDGWSFAFVAMSSFTLFGFTFVAIKKLRVASLVKWNNDNKYILRLYSGLLQIFLSWIVLVQISSIRIWL